MVIINMIKPDLELLSQKIKNSRLRLTRQRRVIYEELAKVDTHPRAEEIYEIVQKRIPHVSFGTVYRNLKALRELGLVAEDKFGHNYSLFNANPLSPPPFPGLGVTGFLTWTTTGNWNWERFNSLVPDLRFTTPELNSTELARIVRKELAKFQGGFYGSNGRGEGP